MTNLVPSTVDFHGARLLVADVGGVPYVAVKPICEALGVDWRGQLQRIKRHYVLSKVVCGINTTTKGGLHRAVRTPKAVVKP